MDVDDEVSFAGQHDAATDANYAEAPMQDDDLSALQPDEQGASEASQPSDSDPSIRRSTLRKLQAALLSSRDGQEELLPTLLAEYAGMAADLSLTPAEWRVYLAALVQSHREACIDACGIEHLLAAHAESFERTVDVRLVRLYVGLVLHYFTTASGIKVTVSASAEGEEADEEQQQQPSSAQLQDTLKEWTGIEGGPTIAASTDTYLPASLPPLRASAEGNAGDTQALKALFDAEAVRSRIRAAYSRCAYHLDESQSVWRLYLAFEMALLTSGQVDAAAQTDMVKQTYLARLRVPHRELDDTFQEYSRFVTAHLPAEEYEGELSGANKLFSLSKKIYSEREQYEDGLAALRAYTEAAGQPRPDSSTFATHWKPYLRWQQRAAARSAKGKDKALAQTEHSIASALYERAIVQHGAYPPSAQAELEMWETSPPSPAKLKELQEQQRNTRRVDKEQRKAEAEQRFTERLSIAEGLWLDYVATLHLAAKPDVSLIFSVCERSVHVLPSSPPVFAGYMRQLSRFSRPKSLVEDVFARIMGSPGIAQTGSHLVELLVARIDCERDAAVRELAATSEVGLDVDPASSMDKFMEVYALLSYGLGETAKLAASQRDATLRLERYAVDWVERAVAALGGPNSEAGAGLNELAESVWQGAVKQQSENARVYREVAAYWARRGDARKARGWFKGGVNKFERSLGGHRTAQADTAQYELLLDDWVQFEHQRGRAEDVDYAVTKAKAERERIWEAWYSSYAAQQQHVMEEPVQSAVPESVSAAANGADTEANTSVAGVKRKSDDALAAASIGLEAAAPPSVGNAAASVSAPTTSADINHHAGDDVAGVKKSKHHDEPSRDRENSSVLVSNLPVDVAPGAIRAFLRDCGEIISLVGPRTVTDPTTGQDSASALVEFSDRDGATSARTRDMKRLHDAIVSVNLGWECTLFVTNFPESWDDGAVRTFFSTYGGIFDVRWPSRKFVSTRRFVYVQFSLPSAARAALEADGRKLDEKCRLSVALSDPSRRKTRSDADANAKELYVSNLSKFAGEAEVRKHFEPFGTVEAVRLPTYEDGKLKGVAFIDFKSPLDAIRAMKELNGSKLKGKMMAVTMAKSRGVHGTVVAPPSSIAAAGGGGSSSTATVAAKTEAGAGAGGVNPSPSAGGLNRAARRAAEAEERRARSIRVRNIPSSAQEALIQQALERELGSGSVRRIYWTAGDESGQATIEFHDVVVAGRAALVPSFSYGESGERIYVVDTSDARLPPPPIASGVGEQGTGFTPRATRGGRARGRGRGGRGMNPHLHPAVTAGAGAGGGEAMDVDVPSSSSSSTTAQTGAEVKGAATNQQKGQDDFRKMLQQ